MGAAFGGPPRPHVEPSDLGRGHISDRRYFDHDGNQISGAADEGANPSRNRNSPSSWHVGDPSLHGRGSITDSHHGRSSRVDDSDSVIHKALEGTHMLLTSLSISVTAVILAYIFGAATGPAAWQWLKSRGNKW
jgi:hypothetical protein